MQDRVMFEYEAFPALFQRRHGCDAQAADLVAPEWTCALTESNMQKENNQCEQPGDRELTWPQHTSTPKKFNVHRCAYRQEDDSLSNAAGARYGIHRSSAMNSFLLPIFNFYFLRAIASAGRSL